jgi:hypothetical protein
VVEVEKIKKKLLKRLNQYSERGQTVGQQQVIPLNTC